MPDEAGPVTTFTRTGIAYDRAGPRGNHAVVLVHAGIADGRMWEPQWSALTGAYDTLRLDLRGFGDSVRVPEGELFPAGDVLDTLVELGIERCHLVGSSLGAGVAVEVALTAPERVESLLLSAPGGSLIPDLTADMTAFIETESSALARGDLDAAVEANVICWVDGLRRGPTDVDPAVRAAVGTMQRQAFEVPAGWDDVEESELDPPALDRLGDVRARTLVLVGGHDVGAIHDAADRLVQGIPDVRRVDWPDVAHLPSMERPEDFLRLLRDWL
ncbi:MAG TPA: alpha/beta fold hydrolase [Propionibacteriaceae bacterium]